MRKPNDRMPCETECDSLPQAGRDALGVIVTGMGYRLLTPFWM